MEIYQKEADRKRAAVQEALPELDPMATKPNNNTITLNLARTNNKSIVSSQQSATVGSSKVFNDKGPILRTWKNDKSSSYRNACVQETRVKQL
jgi:hypothetical protein